MQKTGARLRSPPASIDDAIQGWKARRYALTAQPAGARSAGVATAAERSRPADNGFKREAKLFDSIGFAAVQQQAREPGVSTKSLAAYALPPIRDTAKAMMDLRCMIDSFGEYGCIKHFPNHRSYWCYELLQVSGTKSQFA